MRKNGKNNDFVQRNEVSLLHKSAFSLLHKSERESPGMVNPQYKCFQEKGEKNNNTNNWEIVTHV